MKIRVNKSLIESLKPCASRLENYLFHYADWSGDVQKFLDLASITAQDKIWVVVRVMPRFLVEVFAIDCAMRAQANGAAADATAANYAADYAAADAAAAADYAAADAAAAANYAADATATYAADYAAADTAADDAAATAAERKTQVQILKYLIQTHKEPKNGKK